jgi:hypothetical protein
VLETINQHKSSIVVGYIFERLLVIPLDDIPQDSNQRKCELNLIFVQLNTFFLKTTIFLFPLTVTAFPKLVYTRVLPTWSTLLRNASQKEAATSQNTVSYIGVQFNTM